MADDDLLYTTAVRAAAAIRQRRLSPLELMEAVLARARAIQPSLNPFAALLEERALAEAEAATETKRPDLPLHGVPVSIKDQVDVGGAPTAHGSAIHAGEIAETDDPVVARLRAAGAIVFAKTHLPEFGHKGLTDGPSFGTTRNPWDPSRTSGGSSGGAAVAVACGAGPLAVGTDGAGSIRIPAACCGLVGLKPTLGSIPWRSAADAFGNYTYAGPMTRSVTDAALMRGIMLGPDPADPWTLGRTEAPLSPGLIGRDLGTLRIGVVERTANPRVQAEMAANAHASVAVFTDLGASTEIVGSGIDWIELPGRVMYQAGFAVSLRNRLPEWRDRMDPTLITYMERGDAFSLDQFRQAQFARTRLFRSIQALFESVDVLMMPTLGRTALPATFDGAHDEVEIDGVKSGITRQGWSSYVYPFNLTGHPALTIPSGFDAAGLPTAVQLVGRWGTDLDLLRLGAILEEARPWSAHRPPSV